MEVQLHEIFDIKYGNSLELNALEPCTFDAPNKVNFISRTREDNGVAAFVKRLPDIDPFPSGLITVAGSGSVLESFLQPEPFYTGYHTFLLYPKRPLSDAEKLFYCYCIRQNQYKYNFGRQANKTLKFILVPERMPVEFGDINPDTAITLNKASLTTEIKGALNTSKWRAFEYGGKEGLFTIKGGYYNKKPDHTEAGSVPFIGATEYNNGITELYSLYDIESTNKDENSIEHGLDKKIFQPNCITVANNGASVASAFYQEKEFTCSHDVNILYLKDVELNKYIALFLCSLIRLEKYRWAYGRKWRPIRMPKTEIRLPIDSTGRPDWKFMEEFIKSLPYASSLA